MGVQNWKVARVDSYTVDRLESPMLADWSPGILGLAWWNPAFKIFEPMNGERQNVGILECWGSGLECQILGRLGG